MIRLVVISDSPPSITRYFDQPTVTIGSATSPLADLSLSDEALHEKHIQIIQEKQRFYAINAANDPFATVNGKPFGKKNLYPNDIIQIGNTVIRFELKNELEMTTVSPVSSIKKPPLYSASEEEQSSSLVDTKEILPIILENAMKKTWQKEDVDSESDEAEEKKFAEDADAFEDEGPNPPFSFDLSPEEEQLLLALQNNEVNEPFDEDDFYRQDNSDQTPTDHISHVADVSIKHVDIPDLPNIKCSEYPSFESSTQSLITSVSHPFAENLAMPASIPFNQETVSGKEGQKQDFSSERVKKDGSTLNELFPLQASSLPKPPTTIPKLSLKDYYLSEYDDIAESNPSAASHTTSTIPKILLSVQNWIIYLKMVAVFIIIALIILSLIYLWMTDQSDKEEISASKGVADVAMALTYAQIKNIHPQNQNWSDPEFIKNNLMAILPSRHFSHADFDTHGQFTNCPYLLRIYTSGDLSQFLVIAQPAPSVLQWLIPKSTIMVDSHAMEMRKTKDLKSLNRLLVSANTLDGTSAVEVSHLVRQGEPIHLISLVNQTENLGFSPPKALALMRPGAENLIYNAPRYFSLSEEVMKKSLDLIEKPAGSHEVVRLQQELTALKKLNDVVFYISGGIQNAIHAQKALAMLSPKEKFIIAYLQINGKGQVTNSHLLIDDTLQEAVISESAKPMPLHSTKPIIPTEHPPETNSVDATEPQPQESVTPLPQRSEVDEDNPLFLQFSALNVCRQQALRPINEEILSILNQETQSSQKNFETKIKQLLTKYIEVNNEQQAKIQRKIDGIYRENPHVSASQFFHLAKVAGIRQPLMDYLDHLKKMQYAPEFTQEKLDEHLQRIEKASNWQNFEQEVAELVEILSLERIPDEETVIAFQNATRSRIIQKLNQFILSPEHPQVLQAFDSEYRYTLIHILSMGWITDPDTYDFYLNEFDLRTFPRGSAQNDDGEDEEE